MEHLSTETKDIVEPWVNCFIPSEDKLLPIVLSVPHGGSLKPNSVLDRTSGCQHPDEGTTELSRSIFMALCKNNKRNFQPCLVQHCLHRSKIDPNRDLDFAVDVKSSSVVESWHLYHANIRRALLLSVKIHGFACLVDVHGQDHRNDTTELGYGLTSFELVLSDENLQNRWVINSNSTPHHFNSEGHVVQSRNGMCFSLHSLLHNGISVPEIVRGEFSLGALLEKNGFKCTPNVIVSLTHELDNEIIDGGNLETLLTRHGFAPSLNFAKLLRNNIMNDISSVESFSNSNIVDTISHGNNSLGTKVGTKTKHSITNLTNTTPPSASPIDYFKGIYFWGGYTLQAYTCRNAIPGNVGPLTESDWTLKNPNLNPNQLQSVHTTRNSFESTTTTTTTTTNCNRSNYKKNSEDSIDNCNRSNYKKKSEDSIDGWANKVFCIQLESARSVRVKKKKRDGFATAFALSLLHFLEIHKNFV